MVSRPIIDLLEGDAPPPHPGSRRSAPGLQEARERRRRLIVVVLSCALCILLVSAIEGDHGVLAGTRVRAERSNLEGAVAELRRENQQLQQDSRRLSADPLALEEAARRSLGLVRPGETLIVIRDASAR